MNLLRFVYRKAREVLSAWHVQQVKERGRRRSVEDGEDLVDLMGQDSQF